MIIDGFRRIQNDEGKWVNLGPHFTGGTGEHRHNPVDLGTQKWRVDRIKYQEEILKRIEDWGLWEFVDQPGKMVEKYRTKRRTEIRDSGLERLAQKASSDGLPKNEVGIPTKPPPFEHYPLPSFIRFKHGVDADWLVDRELEDVYVFFLEHELDDPKNDKRHKNKTAEQIKELRELDAHQINLDATTGMSQLTLEPGCGVPIPFCGDAKAPRSLPGTRLVKYDHTNPKHNRELRNTGRFIDADAYLEPVGAKADGDE